MLGTNLHDLGQPIQFFDSDFFKYPKPMILQFWFLEYPELAVLWEIKYSAHTQIYVMNIGSFVPKKVMDVLFRLVNRELERI